MAKAGGAAAERESRHLGALHPASLTWGCPPRWTFKCPGAGWAEMPLEEMNLLGPERRSTARAPTHPKGVEDEAEKSRLLLKERCPNPILASVPQGSSAPGPCVLCREVSAPKCTNTVCVCVHFVLWRGRLAYSRLSSESSKRLRTPGKSQADVMLEN